MKHIFLSALLCMCALSSAFAADYTIKVKVSNTLSVMRESVPVSVAINTDITSAIGGDVASATVTLNGNEVPCQLDDLNDDGIYDELFFMTDMAKKETQTFTILFSAVGKQKEYPVRTLGSVSLRDRSQKNPKHLPIKSLTVPASSNTYQYVFPHGPLLENELVGFRIYADHRQSVDYYGHRQKRIELPETEFYPTKEQMAAGYGEDVLYTGSTYGCGTMHGWDGKKSVMFDNVRSRTYNLVTTGPLRSIIETVNKAWRMTPDARPVDVTTRFTLCAGHRDVQVDVKFSRPVPDLQLSTGVTDIVGSESYTDKKGILACWGTACAGNNPEYYNTRTVGLSVCVPSEYYKGEAYFTNGKEYLPDQAYVTLLSTKTDNLHYWFTVTCDIESFGFADSKAWFSYLKDWKRDLLTPVKVEIQK